jgi:hypothetical protein
LPGHAERCDDLSGSSTSACDQARDNAILEEMAAENF